MIWIVGANGLVGRALRDELCRRGVRAIGTGRELSVLDADSLDSFAAGAFAERDAEAGWIVNGAAFTAVDAAEGERSEAWALNAIAPGTLATLARRRGARLLNLSTDYVFDGKAGRPYAEDDRTNPLSSYGEAKRAGELNALAAAPDTVIARISWVYGRRKPGFVGFMLERLMDQAAGGPPAAAPTDQTSCPSYVGDLAAALADILAASAPAVEGAASESGGDAPAYGKRGAVAASPLPGGVYHLTAPDYASRYEWACEIGRLAAARGLIPPGCLPSPARSAEFPSGAPRPAFSALDSSRLRGRGIGLPSWRIGLSRYFAEVYGAGTEADSSSNPNAATNAAEPNARA